MEKYKKVIQNNKFKISTPTWNDKFKLPDGSCPVSDIQDHFESIFKKYGENIDNASIKMYVNVIGNGITGYYLEKEYYLELLMPETMKLLGSTKSKINKDKNGENVPHLEITEVVLILKCSIANNDYQKDSRVLHTFITNKSFGVLLDISPKKIKFLKTFDSEFSYIEVWSAD